MSDMQSMDRENKKRQLRQNIVQMPDAGSDEPMDDERLARYKKKKRIIAVAAACFLAALGFTGYRYMNEYEYTSYSVQWERSMRYTDTSNADKETQAPETSAAADEGTDGTDETAAAESAAGTDTGNSDSAATSAAEVSKTVSDSSFIRFAVFGDNMIKYTKDGASYIDASGKTIWTQSYEMKTPIININGDYAVIADQQGNEMYICNKEGCTGTAKTQLPITKAAVSARGVAAAVVEDSTASYIFYFKKDGESLGINIKMLLSGDGYPVDIALSPDGKQIVMSIMYMKNGALKNKVAFYDFSEIGKNVNNRFIAAFEEEFDLVTTRPLLFLPHTHTGKSGGQIHGFSLVRNLVFTILSSREWNVIIERRPPGFKRSIIVSMESFNTSSSWFSSMRIAWNVRFAGCPPSARIFAGIAPRMISASCSVVSIGWISRSLTICFAIFFAKRSSP